MAKDSRKLTWGVSLLVLGIIFLLEKTGILALIPYGQLITTFPVLTVIFGIILICTRPRKTSGVIVTLIGLLMNFDELFALPIQYSRYILPIALIIVGVYFILSNNRKNKLRR